MEGLIPFVYRAIVQYRSGGQGGPVGLLRLDESPSGSYMRLPGESGRFRLPEIHAQLFSSPSPPRSPAPAEQSSVCSAYQKATWRITMAILLRVWSGFSCSILLLFDKVCGCLFFLFKLWQGAKIPSSSINQPLIRWHQRRVWRAFVAKLSDMWEYK